MPINKTLEDKTNRLRSCRNCTKVFKYNHGNEEYCKPCKDIARKQKTKLYNQVYYRKTRKNINTNKTCIVCEEQYTPKNKVQKYCNDCGIKVRKAYNRIYGKAYREERRNQ